MQRYAIKSNLDRFFYSSEKLEWKSFKCIDNNHMLKALHAIVVLEKWSVILCYCRIFHPSFLAYKHRLVTQAFHLSSHRNTCDLLLCCIILNIVILHYETNLSPLGYGRKCYFARNKNMQKSYLYVLFFPLAFSLTFCWMSGELNGLYCFVVKTYWLSAIYLYDIDCVFLSLLESWTF